MDEKDFIGGYLQSRDALIRDRATATAVWASFMKFALQWVAQENVLDLGFVTLTPTPFRYDWFDRMIIERGNRRTSWAKKFSRFKFAKWHLTKARITACADGKTVRWNLLVVPSESFHRALAEVEKRRWKTSRYEEEYRDRVKKLLERHAQRNHEILKTYLAEAARPAANLCDIFLFSVTEFPIRKQNPKAFSDLRPPTPIVDVADDSDCVRGVGEGMADGGQKAVDSANASVPCLPDIRSQTEDVRAPGGDVDSTGQPDDGAGAVGLFLLDALESEAPRPVLAGGEIGKLDAGSSLAEQPQQLADHAEKIDHSPPW